MRIPLLKLISCNQFTWMQGPHLKKHIDATLGDGNFSDIISCHCSFYRMTGKVLNWAYITYIFGLQKIIHLTAFSQVGCWRMSKGSFKRAFVES